MQVINKKQIIMFLSTLVLFGSIPVGIYLVNQQQDLRSRAKLSSGNTNPLYVAVEPSIATSSGVFSFSFFEDDSMQVPFEGYIFAKSLTCVVNEQSCTSYTGQWRDFDNNPIYVKEGSVKVNIPKNTFNQTIRLRFFSTHPVKKDNWSNEVVVEISD